MKNRLAEIDFSICCKRFFNLRKIIFVGIDEKNPYFCKTYKAKRKKHAKHHEKTSTRGRGRRITRNSRNGHHPATFHRTFQFLLLPRHCGTKRVAELQRQSHLGRYVLPLRRKSLCRFRIALRFQLLHPIRQPAVARKRFQGTVLLAARPSFPFRQPERLVFHGGGVGALLFSGLHPSAHLPSERQVAADTGLRPAHPAPALILRHPGGLRPGIRHSGRTHRTFVAHKLSPYNKAARSGKPYA